MDKKRKEGKINNMNLTLIRIMEATSFLSETHNWKSTRRDKIPNCL